MEASPQGVGVSDVNLDGTDACIERERLVSWRGLTLDLISPNTCRNTEVQIPQSGLQWSLLFNFAFTDYISSNLAHHTSLTSSTKEVNRDRFCSMA